jgi:hypothetical protein
VAPKLDPTAIADDLRTHLTGGEPRADLVEVLGGWAALEVLAPTLVDDPLLRPAMMLLQRGIDKTRADGNDFDTLRPAAAALASTVIATTDPGLFADAMNSMCSNADLADLVGDQVAAACIPLAGAPRADGDVPAEPVALRHAVALEAAARLAVLGHGTRHDVLSVLAKVREPQPLVYARAVARAVGVAYDHWNAADAADDVADVLDILTGLTPPTRASEHTGTDAAQVRARDEELRLDIAADASWTKATVDVARALRADSGPDIVARLDGALDSLTYVTTVDDRPDAVVHKSALGLLRGLLTSLGPGAEPLDAHTWDAAITEAQMVVRQAAALELDTRGLNHWSGERKLAVLQGWTRFVEDLARLRDHLDRDSLYEVAVVLDDILAIYTVSSSYDVIATGAGVEHVMRVIRPAVERGFAARSGLLRNLSDHTDSLRARVAAAEADPDNVPGEDLAELRGRLETAATVLAAARTSLSAAAAGPPGKQPEQEAQLPPLLAELLAPDTARAFTGVDRAHLDALEAAIADRRVATDVDPDLVITSVRNDILTKLKASPDFTGDVADAVTIVVEQLIKFIANRLDTQPAWHSYLFKADADEKDLQLDLFGWLYGGRLGSGTLIEVQHIGGGRVDLLITFTGFRLVVELKEDETQVPLQDKIAYIKQTSAYQATGVRIGFLVVLRSKAASAASPPPHLRDLITHTVLEVTAEAPERHVVMFELPGDRTSPSKMK